MATNSLATNIAQAQSDLLSVKNALIAKGESIPDGTPTSTYGSKITALASPKPEETKSVTYASNGSYSIQPITGKVISSVWVTVAVPDSTPNLQDKTVEITENGTTVVTADELYDGLDAVTVTVDVSSGGDNPIVVESESELLALDTNENSNKFIQWGDRYFQVSDSGTYEPYDKEYTEIDITLTPGTGLDFEINLFNNVTSIDWGDGSTSTALGSHTYSDYGDYTIKVYASGAMSDGGYDVYVDAFISMFGPVSNSAPNYSVTAVRFGNTITRIGAYAFSYCYSLTSVTIPSSVTSIGAYVFDHCCSLTNITIPSSFTRIGSYAFNYCYSLTNITIPDSVTSIGSYAFSYCYSLKSITIPDSVTSIGAYAFSNCDSIIEYDFTSYTSTDTVPTLSSTDAFMGINGICKMYFRDQATLDNFASATNWSAYADYMYIKEN